MTKRNPLTRSKFSQGFPALPLREGLLLCRKSARIFGFLHKVCPAHCFFAQKYVILGQMRSPAGNRREKRGK